MRYTTKSDHPQWFLGLYLGLYELTTTTSFRVNRKDLHIFGSHLGGELPTITVNACKCSVWGRYMIDDALHVMLEK